MTELRKSLRGVQFFSIGFGGIVGVGWIVYMGLWFNQAGPVGTVVAFLVGGGLMALVGLCYAEIGAMYPVAGGEAAYAYGAFGRATAFTVGWSLLLLFTAVVPYVSVSLAWILGALVPGFDGPVLYTWRGQPIHALALAIALLWTLWLGWVNHRGIHAAARFQDWLTYGKLAISLLFFAAGIFGGSVRNLEPMWVVSASGSAWAGFFAVLATTPWFFGGFNFIPQLMEERAEGMSSRSMGLIVVLSIIAAGVYYALAALAAGMAGPWQQIVSADLPVADAFRLAFGSEWLARVVLLAGLLGIVTVGNGASMAATRVLFALGRARMISPAFAALHPVYASPTTAIVLVTAMGLTGDFLGRGGIAPLVGVGSTAASLAYFVTSIGVWRLRRTRPDQPRPYRIPLGLLVSSFASVGSILLMASSLRQQWIDAGFSFPLEWGVIVVWTIAGVVMYRGAAPLRMAMTSDEQRRLMMGGA